MANNDPQRHPQPGLLFTFGLRKGENVKISANTMIIGRDPSADIQLDSPFVSRQHAKIVFEGGYWHVVDLDSKNGVYHAAIRIQPNAKVRLSEGDLIQIGSVSAFEFHDPEATIRQSEMKLMLPGLWLDEPKRDVFINGHRVMPPLSSQQFDLLAALFHHAGDVVENTEIGIVLWPDALGGIESAAIDNAVSRLRDRLAELDEAHDYIETVRGVGRRFVQRD